MKKGWRRTLLIVLAVVALLVVAAMAVVKAVYLDRLKPRIEQAASEATGLDVTVGSMGLDIFPSLAVAVKGISVKGDKSEVLAVKEADVSVALGPLLSKRIEVTGVRVVNPVVNIVKGKDGKYNYEGRKAAKKEAGKEEGAPPFAGLLARNISVKGGQFTYTEEATKSRTEVKDLDIDVRDVSIGALPEKKEFSAVLKAIALRGDLRAGSFESGNYKVSDISSDYALKDGVLDISPMKFKLYGGSAEGKCSIDLGGKKTKVDLAQDVKGLDLGAMVRETSGKDAVAGKTNLKAKLSMRGASAEEMRRSLGGEISLRGANLVLKGVDLDASLARIEETQKFDLFDAGSLLVLGPVGPLITKGTDVAGLAVGGVKRGEESLITRYVFDLAISGGMARTKDVAFTTMKNRIAFDGKLDLVNGRFQDFTGAVLKPDGCSKFEQTIVGPFGKPTVKKEGLVKSVIKPITSLLGKVIPQGECTPFYTGSVEHPSP